MASRISLGLMRISEMNVDEVESLIEGSLAMGIYYFDIADIYGHTKCESLLGEVLTRHPSWREKMYIQTKVGIRMDQVGYDSSYEYILKAVEASLNRLKIKTLDSLLIHRPDILMSAEEVAKAVKELLKRGWIKDFGVSNFSSSEILYLQEELPVKIKYNQVQLGIGNTTMLDQTMYTNVPCSMVSKEQDDLLFFLKREKIVIQCWSPYQVDFFKGSIFDETKAPKIYPVLVKYAKKYQTSLCAIATAFLLKIDPNLWVITGSCDLKHIQESLDGEKINLSRADWYGMYKEVGNFLP